jgi:hypothetical protein
MFGSSASPITPTAIPCRAGCESTPSTYGVIILDISAGSNQVAAKDRVDAGTASSVGRARCQER